MNNIANELKKEYETYKHLWDEFDGEIGDEKAKFNVYKDGDIIDTMEIDTIEIDQLYKTIVEAEKKELEKINAANSTVMCAPILDQRNITHNAVGLLIGRRLSK